MIDFKSLIKKFPSVWSLYWNSKWPKSNIYYETKSGEDRVIVNTILNSTCPEIFEVAERICSYSKTDDDKAYQCMLFVKNSIHYKGDIFMHEKSEYWQEAPETFATKEGDCEDGAILMMKLMEACGIPAWRRKMCAGYVDSGNIIGGHAYVIYLADDFEWYVLDWCYWPNLSQKYFLKVPQRRRPEYKEIWFTFNEEHMWAQHDLNLG